MVHDVKFAFVELLAEVEETTLLGIAIASYLRDHDNVDDLISDLKEMASESPAVLTKVLGQRGMDLLSHL